MITEDKLDELLGASCPTIDHEEACSACASAITVGSATRHPVRRRLAVAGFAGTAVLAVGAGAAATVGLPIVGDTHPDAVAHTQVVSNGDRCYATYSVFSEDGKADPATLTAARTALASLKIDDLNINNSLKYINHEYDNTTWDGPGPRPQFVYATDSQDSRENAALSHAVAEAVADTVQAQGYPTSSWGLLTESKCDDAARAIQK